MIFEKMKRAVLPSILIFVSIVLHLGGSVSATQSLKAARSESGDSNTVNRLLDQAKNLRRTDPAKSYTLAKEASDLSRQLSWKIGIARSEFSKASASYNGGNLRQADSLSRRAVTLLEKDGSFGDQAGNFNLLGLILMNAGGYIEAERWFRKAEEKFSIAGDLRGQVKALSNLGVINFYQSRYDQSTRYYLLALRGAEKTNDPFLIAEVNANLGLGYSTQKDFTKAIWYLRIALPLYRQAKDARGEGRALAGIGTAFFNVGKLDSALIYYDLATPIFKETADVSGMGQVINNIGEVYLQQRKYINAIPLFDEALKIRTENNEAYGIAITLTNLAKAWSGRGNTKRAAMLFDSAGVVARKLGIDWFLAEFHISRAEYLEQQGDYRRALDEFRRYALIRDTIFSNEKARTISELQTIYESEKKENQLLLKDKQILLLEQTRNYYLTGILLVVLIALFLYIIYSRKRIKEQQVLLEARQNRLVAERRSRMAETELEQSQLKAQQLASELEFRRREITQLALHINYKNEILENIRNTNQLANIDFTGVDSTIERQLDIVKQREDFDININLIHADFYQKLMTRFPTLTENDRKLCAMLRLGLSSKEIAGVQNISPKSVDMTRYRLRKKFNLGIDVDLVKWLNEI